MSEYDPLHDRLTRLAEKTATAAALAPPSWRVGDRAGERQVRDSIESGRLHWREAHRTALQGLDELGRGDREAAEAYAWIATDHYVAALEARIRPADLSDLGQSPSRRGRRKKINN